MKIKPYITFPNLHRWNYTIWCSLRSSAGNPIFVGCYSSTGDTFSASLASSTRLITINPLIIIKSWHCNKKYSDKEKQRHIVQLNHLLSFAFIHTLIFSKYRLYFSFCYTFMHDNTHTLVDIPQRRHHN